MSQTHKNSFYIAAAVFIMTTSLFVFPEDFFNLKKNIVNNSWRRIGFVYVQPSLLLKEVGYSSNIYYYGDNVQPDWTADIGTELRLSSILGKRFIFRITETPYYSFYLHNKSEENFNNRFRGEAFSHFGNININYSYSFGRYKSRPTSEFGARTNIKNRVNDISVEFGDQRSLFAGLYYSNGKITYEDRNYLDNYDLPGSMDKIDNVFGGFLNIPIFTKTRLLLKFEYFEYAFINESIRDGIGDRAYLEIKFPEISIIRGSFTIGLKYFKPGAQGAEEYIKPVGSGKISLRFLRKLKFNFGYAIDNQYSFWELDAYYDHISFNIGADFYATRNLRIGYNYSSEKNRYRKISGDAIGRNDNITTSEGTIVLRVSSNTGIGIKYTFFSSGSSIPGFNRNYSFIGGYLTHEF